MCQKSSSDLTIGAVEKFQTGVGDGMAHSNVLASHGSNGAFSPFLFEKIQLIMKTIIDKAMIKAPTVTTIFQNCKFVSSAYTQVRLT